MNAMVYEEIAGRVAVRRVDYFNGLIAELALSEPSAQRLRTVLRISSSEDKGGAVYAAYPCLFLEAFESVDKTILLELSWASRCALDHVILYDAIIDYGRADSALLFASYRLRDEYRSSLAKLFAPGHPVWTHHDDYECAAYQAIRDEVDRRSSPQVLNFDRYGSDSVAKSSLSKLAIHALAELAPSHAKAGIPDLLASSDLFYAAYQVIDDLLDWRQDFRNNTISYLIAQALTLCREGRPEHSAVSENEVGAAIYTRIFPALHNLVNDRLESALSLAQPHLGTDGGWCRVIQTQLNQLRKLHDAISPTIAIQPLPPGPIDHALVTKRVHLAVVRGIRFLEDEAAHGYADLTHRMVFPQSEGFQGGGVSEGAVFQRALLSRVLSIAGTGYGIDKQLVIDQLAFLESARDENSGGWKYFPELLELPPDADDVGQVLLAFLEAGVPDTSARFTRVLKLINSLTDVHGAELPSWLVNPDLNDPEATAYRAATSKWWGDGVDVEVVANLAYALHRLGDPKMKDWVTQATMWVTTRQGGHGNWEGVWYWGQTYATWMAVRLLLEVETNHPCLATAADWWLAHWKNSLRTPSEAAFGLQMSVHLSRAGLLRGGPEVNLMVAEHLLSIQADDGGWDACPWIRMDINRASKQRGQGESRYLSHGSRSLSTILCLHALLDLLNESPKND